MGSLGRLLQRVSASLIVVFTVSVAGLVLMTQIEARPVFALAKQVEGGSIIDKALWPKIDKLLTDAGSTGVNCLGGLAYARFIVSLAKVDSFTQQNDRQIAIAAIDSALEKGRDLLRCRPMSGDAWLRFARVSVAREGFTPKTIQEFDLSDRLSPSEGWLINIRLPIYAIFAKDKFPGGFQTRATRDMELLTAYGVSPSNTMRILQSWPKQLAEGFVNGLKILPPKPRQTYLELTKNEGINIDKSAPGETIVDPFTGKAMNDTSAK